MKRFILIILVFLLFGAPSSFAENVTDGTGALAAVTTGDENTAIGGYTLKSLTTGYGNTALGAYAGLSALTVNGGVYLGYGAGISNTSAHKLYINTMFYPTNGIFGDFSTGYFGVNTTSPTSAWTISGTATADTTVSARFQSSIAGAATDAILSSSVDKDTGLYWLANYGNRLGVTAKGTQVTLIDSVGVGVQTGTAAAPTLHNLNDRDTGLYWLTATGNRLGLTAKGTSMAIVDSTGIVVSKVAKADTLNVTNSAVMGYGIVNGATILRGTNTLTGKTDSDYTEATGTADGTRYIDHLVTMNADPAASAEVTGLYSRVDKRLGSNGTYTLNGIEGVAASYYPDEAGTFRGGLFRTYVSADDSSTMRTNIGLEASARASYSGGTECVAESGTAFTGARIWMAPYFSAATVSNLNNFWGLWIYGEHATQRNADSALKISDAGGGFTHDLTLQSGDTIDNTLSGKLDLNTFTRVTGEVAGSDTLQVWRASGGTEVADMDSLGVLTLKQVTADTLKTTNFAATGYGIVNGAFIGRGGSTITGSASADTTKGTNASFTGYLIANGATILRGGATVTGNISSTGYMSSFPNVQAIEADSTLTSVVMPPGSIITNGAAGATIEVTLPTAVVGLNYKFVTSDTDSLIVVAGASDTITDNTGTGKADYAAVGTVGETIELVAITDAIWQVMNKLGTWESR